MVRLSPLRRSPAGDGPGNASVCLLFNSPQHSNNNFLIFVCNYHIHRVDEADEFRQHFVVLKLESIPCLKYSKKVAKFGSSQEKTRELQEIKFRSKEKKKKNATVPRKMESWNRVSFMTTSILKQVSSKRRNSNLHLHLVTALQLGASAASPESLKDSPYNIFSGSLEDTLGYNESQVGQTCTWYAGIRAFHHSTQEPWLHSQPENWFVSTDLKPVSVYSKL